MASFSANAVLEPTLFAATDGDVNIINFTDLSGFELYMFDESTDNSMALPSPSIVGITGPTAGGDWLATSETPEALVLTGPNPYFYFKLLHIDSGTLLTDLGADCPGANACQLEFARSGSVIAVVDVQQVPVPAAAWLFGSGLIGLAGIARRKRATA